MLNVRAGLSAVPCRAVSERAQTQRLGGRLQSDVWDRSRLAHGGRTDGSRPVGLACSDFYPILGLAQARRC